MKSYKTLTLLVCALITLCFVVSVSAQTTTTLYGTVSDKTGAIVPGAQVTATNTGTNLARSAQTTAEGTYRFEFMPIGAYTVEVTATGFKKFVQKGIALEVNVNARVDAALDIGAMTEEINVTASAPLVNTDNAQIGRTVENSEITTLPIVGRNVYTLLNLTPGVASTVNSIVLGFPEQRTMINGGVDGGAGSVNYLPGRRHQHDRPAQHRQHRAQSGRGGRVPRHHQQLQRRVRTLRRRRDQHHHPLRHQPFSRFAVRVLPQQRPERLSVASLDRPLRCTAISSAARSAARSARTRRSSSAPTPACGRLPAALSSIRPWCPRPERTGNFSQSKIAPNDPTNGNTPFAGDIIPVTRLDPDGAEYPEQVHSGGQSAGHLWQGAIPSPYNTNEVLVKIDHSFSDRQRLTGSYFETAGTIPSRRRQLCLVHARISTGGSRTSTPATRSPSTRTW